jgi:hypothetical protein
MWLRRCGRPARGWHRARCLEEHVSQERQAGSLLTLICGNSRCPLSAENQELSPEALSRALLAVSIPQDRLQRRQKHENGEFIPVNDYGTESVAMLSDQDSSDWRSWWEREAGTVDEGLFARTAAELAIGRRVWQGWFDGTRSLEGRLRWRPDFSVQDLVEDAGQTEEALSPLIDLYRASSGEKERLWDMLGTGALRELGDPGLVSQALELTLGSSAGLAENTFFDWVSACGLAGPDGFRLHTPGDRSEKDWRSVLPVPMEELLGEKTTGQVRALLTKHARNAGRG